MLPPFKKVSLVMIPAVALGLVTAGCSDSPTAVPWTEQLTVTAEISRAAFQAGDTTSIRVRITNTSNQTVISYRTSNTCGPQYEILKGNQVVGPGVANPICLLFALAPPDTLAPGQSKVLSYQWRGDNFDWAVLLSPGLYELRGKLGVGDDVIRSEPVPVQIL